MGTKSQRKGRGGELELARLLQEYGYVVQPGQAVSYGATPDLVGLPGIYVECKRVEKLNVPEAMKQAVMDSEKFHDGAPTLFHRRSREPWLVTMRLQDWIGLYSLKTTENDRKEGENPDTETTESPCRSADKSDEGGGGKGGWY